MSAPRKILHPTDFSEQAEAALEVAYALALDCEGSVVILHVLPDAVAAGVEALVPVDVEAARAALARVAGAPGGRTLAQPLESHLSQGDPAEEIVRTAEELGCDLIVMGTQGRTGLARVLMGSVAESVLRGAGCPVLVVRSPGRRPGPFRARTILHPTDFSEESRSALREAVALAGGEARVIVLHVPHADEPPVWVYDRMAGGAVDPERLLARIARETDPFRAENPQILFEHRLGEGNPTEEILRTADAEGCDLIVMGTGGRGGLDRILLGSVAEGVMRRASCPVMAMRKPHGAGAAQVADLGRSSHA